MAYEKKKIIQERFIKFLESKMTEKGLSLRELGRRADIAASYLSHLKSFKNNIPSNEKLYKIAEVLEIDPSEILIEAGRAPEDDLDMLIMMRAFGKIEDQKTRESVLNIIKEIAKTED